MGIKMKYRPKHLVEMVKRTKNRPPNKRPYFVEHMLKMTMHSVVAQLLDGKPNEYQIEA
jgi:hypothetical protein